MEINIYLDSTVRGPHKSDGWCAFIIEARKGTAITTKESFEFIEQRTANQMHLITLYHALKRFTRPSVITIHTDCGYLVNSVNEGWMERWQKSTWKNKSGQEVKNKYLWQLVYDLSRGHQVKATYEKHHEYKNWMQAEMKRRQEDERNDVSKGKEKEKAEETQEKHSAGSGDKTMLPVQFGRRWPDQTGT